MPPFDRRMTLRTITLPIFISAALGVAVSTTALAQPAGAWPERPLHLIVPFAPAGPPDQVARLIAPRLGELLGQPVIIENRTGAGGNIGTAAAARAAPDGYTVLLTSSAFAVNTNFSESGYTAERDFAPVTIIAAQANVVVVHPSMPVKTLAEFFVYSRDRKLAFATPGSGTTPHLTGENLFNLVGRQGLPAIHYRGAGPATAAVLGNEPAVGVLALSGPLQNIKAGKLRALAVSSAKRQAQLPDVPTLAEAGYKGMLDYTWVGMFVPAATPAQIVNRLYGALQRVVHSPDVKEQIAALAFDTMAEPPAQTADFVHGEVSRWGEVVKKIGLKPE